MRIKLNGKTITIKPLAEIENEARADFDREKSANPSIQAYQSENMYMAMCLGKLQAYYHALVENIELAIPIPEVKGEIVNQ